MDEGRALMRICLHEIIRAPISCRQPSMQCTVTRLRVRHRLAADPEALRSAHVKLRKCGRCTESCGSCSGSTRRSAGALNSWMRLIFQHTISTTRFEPIYIGGSGAPPMRRPPIAWH